MNIEDFREYCLSLGDVEEKLPFAKMPGGDTVLVFYVDGHTFCYCDLDGFRSVIVKCQTERIPELMENQGVCTPDSHFNSKYWIGINPYTDADLNWRDKNSRSTLEMKDKSSRPAIKGHCDNIADYDVVWIGFPIWWYTAPTIVNTFIEAHDLSGKTLNVFATSGGSDVKDSYNDLKKAYPQYNWGESRLMNR